MNDIAEHCQCVESDYCVALKQ